MTVKYTGYRIVNLRLCKTARPNAVNGFKIHSQDLKKNLRLREVKSPKNKTLRAIDKCFKDFKIGLIFRDPRFSRDCSLTQIWCHEIIC